MCTSKVKRLFYLSLLILSVGCGREGTQGEPQNLKNEIAKETPKESSSTALVLQEEPQQTKVIEGQGEEAVETSSSNIVVIGELDKGTAQVTKSKKSQQSVEAKLSTSPQTKVINNMGEKQPHESEIKQKGASTSRAKQGEKKSESEQKVATVSISCANILSHKEEFNADKLSILPQDGVILQSEQVEVKDGDTVFDVLVRVTKEHKIHMEYTGSSMYNTNYIEGINNIYEFDCGPLSGWMYKVNNVFPNYGCSAYTLEGGDVVEWVYTCDLGNDVGAEEITQEGEGK